MKQHMKSIMTFTPEDEYDKETFSELISSTIAALIKEGFRIISKEKTTEGFTITVEQEISY